MIAIDELDSPLLGFQIANYEEDISEAKVVFPIFYDCSNGLLSIANFVVVSFTNVVRRKYCFLDFLVDKNSNL